MKKSRWKRNADLIFGIIMAVVMLAACGSGEYGEMEDIVKDQADITEAYVTGLEEAKSAEDVAEVINEFTDGMKTLIPKIKAYQEVHPDAWLNTDDVPEKIKVQQARLEAASGKIQGAFMNQMTYMMNSEVQEAMMNMSTEMSKLQ